MKQVFPKEFLEFTVDVHRFRHRNKGAIIYGLLLMFMIGACSALPFVRIPLYISSRGTILREFYPKAGLVAESYIRAGDIALIRESTPVTLQIDAFDHNHWGLATGEILEVSRNAIFRQNQAVFRIRCRLNETYLSLPNNRRGYLSSGQTLTVHIQLTERSLIDLFQDKWYDWLDTNAHN